MDEIEELSSMLDRELEAITLAPTGPSNVASSRIGGKASSRAVKLFNPKIITEENKIEILGPVFLISVAELKKSLKNRYKTPGKNIFPEVVDDYVYKNGMDAMSRLSSFDSGQAASDLVNLSRLVKVPSDAEKIALVRRIKPLELVDEYIIDGKHTTGSFLGSLDLPLVVMTDDGAQFDFESPSNVVGMGRRAEESMSANMKSIMMIAERVDDNTIQTTSGLEHVLLGNTMAVVSLICLLIGAFALIERRLFFFIILFICGVALAVARYLPTSWNRGFFGVAETHVIGNGYTVFKFYGDLA